MERLREVATPLAERRFRRLFLAVSASRFGDGFKDVALAFAVLDLTGSPTDLGLVLAASTISMVGFLTFGGVFADRLGRRAVMVAADITRFGALASIAALLLTGQARIWHLVLLQVVNGAGSAFFYPASTGLVPEVVRPANLQPANAALSLAGSAGEIAGPPLAGLLVALTSPGWGIAVDALTYAVSGALLVRLGPTGYVRLGAPRSFASELREGWSEVRSRTWLWSSILGASLFQFSVFGALFVLGPVVAERSLGGARSWGILLGALGAGTVAGGLLALVLRPRRLLRTAYLATLFALPALLLLAWGAPLLSLAAAFVAGGIGLAVSATFADVVLQQHVPARALSRVSAIDWMGSTALRPLGFAVAGPVAGAIGLAAALVAAAVVGAASILAVLGLRSVRELEWHGEADADEDELPPAQPPVEAPRAT